MERSQSTPPANVTAPDEATAAEILRLRNEVQQYEEFLEGLPDAVVVIDLTSNQVVAINHMTTIVMGFTAEDVAAGLSAARLAPLEEFQRMNEISHEFIKQGLEKGGGRYARSDEYNAMEVRLLKRDGSEFFAEVNAAYVMDANGYPRLMRGIIRDISVRVQQEIAHRATIAQLEAALHEVRTLRGLIPMCAWCHKIRDDQGYWQQLEKFLRDNSDANFTHSICDECSTVVLSAHEPPVEPAG